ncbi:flagellar basal-body MS-ring/collar protein FliF [Desulforhopalus sp. IMCC35007]|uniref:flagellar basal-body MS-ring/collar protein FliF n=1 Tax=Desulforhopalus sp. IMCC35007 TaxID=2569543 RepID=UPI0010AE00EE|nr:flagellar basal-body MS-ring/collar protein FliF [Desulforhopalus sp. IMCC35007]TKB10296.1 flagellar M-ring protein FliF [Desulforhopalus sp. IMCC35007]
MEVAEKSVETTTSQPATIEKKNLIQLVQGWPLSRKVATGAVLVISIALFALLIIQARTVDQQLLYANLPMNDASQVVEWLKNQKIDYTLKNGGKDIWIPANQIYQTRLDLAANGMPTGGGVGFEIFDKQSFALTDYVQKVNYTRALQGELARTITSLAPVESTRVHLALPEKRLFKNQQSSGTASVIVTLVPGKHLDQQQVQGIIHLVAGSVTNLDPENVKVIDSNGVVLELEKKKDESQIFSGEMLEFQQEVEHRMEMRAQALLDKTMGTDNAMVRISATLDFSKVEKTEELYDGEEPVIRSEQVNEELSGSETDGGVPGVESNLQGNVFGENTAGPTDTKTSRTTNYEISKTISRIINPVGTITKLSVSVLVADRVALDADGKVKEVTPRSEEELKSIEEMVASAIGIVAERGDVINVISMPFVAQKEEAITAGGEGESSLYQSLPMIKYGLIALGALLIYFLLIRPVVKTMKGEVKEHYKTVEQLEREQKLLQQEKVEPELPVEPVDDTITQLRREVNQNQVPTAFIIKNWIQEG